MWIINFWSKMFDDIGENIDEIERINKSIINNYNDLSKIKPIKFFEYETMRPMLRLIYNQERIIKLLRIIYRNMEK